MAPTDISARLCSLIGARIPWQGGCCLVIDIIGSDPPAVVLRSCDTAPPIQSDQFGNATRRCQRTFTVPACNPHGTLDPLFAELLGTLEGTAG